MSKKAVRKPGMGPLPHGAVRRPFIQDDGDFHAVAIPGSVGGVDARAIYYRPVEMRRLAFWLINCADWIEKKGKAGGN